jgi:hypothetical protein
MGLSYDIDSAREHVRIVGRGQLTMPEMIAVVERVAGDPRLLPHFTAILDIRDAEYTADLNDGDAFVEGLKRTEKYFQNRFVLLVPESLHFLGTLFCLLAKASGVDRMKCSMKIEEAEAWCGLVT